MNAQADTPEKLQKSTLQCYTKGSIPKSQSNAECGYLTRGEANEVVNYCLEMADRGFLLTHQDLRIEVNSILRARCGESFQGVGVQWTYRFLEKYRNHLKMFWSSSLEEKRDILAGKHDWEFDKPVQIEDEDWDDEGANKNQEITFDTVVEVINERELLR
ncbi:hypothetical protein VKT23_017099 [Stygiomarasmius scandens]|uniref:HTH CENPB-type domain-containing protein n=1 Tax=Marasmiellus scandens TaxID=2682957 RepID=A0ABR1ITE3_9AGAR